MRQPLNGVGFILAEAVPLAHYWRHIDFAAVPIWRSLSPWGDLATAGFSTGIPNIETYVAVPRAVAYASRALNWLRPLLASAPGQVLLHRLANCISGPSEKQLRTGRSRLWARCVMRQASDARHIWKLATVIA